MEQSDPTDPISMLSAETGGQEATEQSSVSKLKDAESSEGRHPELVNKDEARATGNEHTIRCFCGLSDDDGNMIACERCREWQHITCYYPDQENETLGDDFQHICVNCASPQDAAETSDEEEDSEYEYTSGYSGASAAASQFGEASTEGHNVPDVFLYMTQDVQYAPASADDDTLRVPPVNDAVQEFRVQLFALSQIPLKWEDPKRLDEALSVIPLDQINEQAQTAMEEATLQRTQGLSLSDSEVRQDRDDAWGYNDFIIIALMQWFKRDFFSWETNVSCLVCSSPTIPHGETEPTAQEREDSALVVELYTCCNPDCGASERFPRYSDPWRLLVTRRGRLAEWANCFGMLCRAVGARVRWTWNADKGHIWLEVYSEKKTRWVSVDIFEVAWDKPLLYTQGNLLSCYFFVNFAPFPLDLALETLLIPFDCLLEPVRSKLILQFSSMGPKDELLHRLFRQRPNRRHQALRTQR